MLPNSLLGEGGCLKSVCFQEESPGGATALLILNVFLVLTEKIPGIEPDFFQQLPNLLYALTLKVCL